MNDLLELARGQLSSPGPHANRWASWLARAALEEAIDGLLTARGVDVGERASGRSRLSCLEVLYEDDPQLPARAQYAWSRLSEACHQHAYQLSPTHTEVKHLLDLVEGLVSSAGAK